MSLYLSVRSSAVSDYTRIARVSGSRPVTALCRGELSAAIIRLMSKCSCRGWKWKRGVRIDLLPSPAVL